MKWKRSEDWFPDDCHCRYHASQLSGVDWRRKLLPALFGQIVIAEAVFRELQATATPAKVQQWTANRPQWLEIRQTSTPADSTLSHLDEGERQAIQLAEELGADLLLVDEQAARKEAARRHLATSERLECWILPQTKDWLILLRHCNASNKEAFIYQFLLSSSFSSGTRKEKLASHSCQSKEYKASLMPIASGSSGTKSRR